MVSASEGGIKTPTLTVFNTLIRQACSGSSRRLSFPSGCYEEDDVLLRVDQDRCLGTSNGDGPLITDPTQAILVIEFLAPQWRCILLAVRVQALIESICSTCTDGPIPWGDWGRGAVFMVTPRFSPDSPIYVHGTHVMVGAPLRQRDRVSIRTFDFGRRGRSVLPLWDEEDGGDERRALFEGGQEFMLEGVMWWSNIRSLGDGQLFGPVSYLSHPGSNSLVADTLT